MLSIYPVPFTINYKNNKYSYMYGIIQYMYVIR